MQTYNIAGVQAYEWSEISNGRQLAEHIAAGLVGDLEKSDTADKLIIEAAQYLLRNDEIEAYSDWDTDECDFYDLPGGQIGVHWAAAQILEIGTVAELATKYVKEFRRWREDDLLDTFDQRIENGTESELTEVKIVGDLVILAGLETLTDEERVRFQEVDRSAWRYFKLAPGIIGLHRDDCTDVGTISELAEVCVADFRQHDISNQLKSQYVNCVYRYSTVIDLMPPRP